MKPNPKNRYNGRYNNRNARTVITRNTALESSGPNGKLHGTALQLIEKYQAAAKDALIQNDLVLAQTCLQYADHYTRIQNIAIANDMAMRGPQQNTSNNAGKVVEEQDVAPESEIADEMPKFTVPAESVEKGDIASETVDMPETTDTSVAETANEKADKPAEKTMKKGNGRRRTLQVHQSATKSTEEQTKASQIDMPDSDTQTATEKPAVTGPVIVRRRSVRVQETPAAVSE